MAPARHMPGGLFFYGLFLFDCRAAIASLSSAVSLVHSLTVAEPWP